MRNWKFAIVNFKLFAAITGALGLALALAFAPNALASAPQQLLAAGGVSTCADAALRAALAGGGTITFNIVGRCTITVNPSFVITAPTTINGSGANITLSGGSVRRIITTTTGVGTLAIQGITLTGGLVLSGTSIDGSGAALLVRGNLLLTGVVFLTNTSNADGGAVYATGIVTDTGNTFQNNSANPTTGQGGGLFTQGSLALNGSQFRRNSAGAGGGAYANGNAGGVNATFDSNLANDLARGGGGLYANGTLNLTNGQFRANTGGAGGGALAIGVAMISGTLFESNHATGTSFGGGGLNAQSDVVLANATFLSNTSAYIGGGAYAFGVATVNGGTFQANSAGGGQDGGGLTADGGALSLGTNGSRNSRVVNSFIAGNTAGSGAGAAIVWWNSNHTFEVLHTTISSPTISAGSAIRILDGSVGITDTIIANYSTGIDRASGSVHEDYNLFSGVTNPTINLVTSGPHHPAGSPAFINPLADDYHLSAASAAIDAAIWAGVSTDIDGQARPQGGGFDIGADESAFTVDLVIAKSVAPAQAAPGAPVTFTLAFTQAGSGGMAYGVHITDQLPLSLTNIAFASSGAAITATTGYSFAWQVADLPAGAAGRITVTGIISVPLAGLPIVLTNTAFITATTGDSNPANNRSSALLDVQGPIIGLSASNSSPTPFGHATTLTATVASGLGITYQWNFGDGSGTGSGAVVNHTYPAIGAFTATITATNAFNSSVQATNVTITGFKLDLPLVVR